MTSDASMEAIRERFNRIRWHDSKLLTLCIVPSGGESLDGDVIMGVVLQPLESNAQARRAQLVLRNCTIVRINFDIASKRACSDDITSASCQIESSLKSQIEREQLRAERHPLASYLHFWFVLCPPSGEMHAFARTFDLEIGEEVSAESSG